MLFEPSSSVAVIVDCIVWAVLGVAVGWHNSRLPIERVLEDGWLPALRSWEARGRWYESRLRIKRWKDRLPEAGTTFRGGVSKRRLPAKDRVGLVRFAAETRRAERVHWTLLGCGALFPLWNGPALSAAMLGYAVVANVPFLLVQRYNRARIEALLSRGQRSRPAEPTAVGERERRAVTPAD